MKEYYFDNSATSNPKPQNVIDSVYKAITSLNGNSGRGAYDRAINISREIYNTRKKIADFFNINNPLQIAFTQNSTASLNYAIKGLRLENCHIITSVLEHNSVLRPVHYLEDEKNVTVSYLEPQENYEELIKNFTSLIKEDTKLVVINHISNLTGYIMDIKSIGKICRERGITFIVDASQSAGFTKIDVEDMNIDILCFTGHKSLFGIQGIGGIYVREGIEVHSILEGGTGSFSKLRRQPTVMPEALECGTLNVPGIISLSAGIDFINSIELDNIKKHEEKLTEYFINKLLEIDGITIYGDVNKKRGPVVSINFQDINSSEFAEALNEEFGISTRSGFHCAPLAHKFYGTYEQGTVRFSFSYFNTIEEVKFAIGAICKLVSF